MLLIRSIIVSTPISKVEFYIILISILFLLSLRDIDILNVYFNNLINTLVTLVTLNSKVLIIHRFSYLFLL